MGIEKDYLMRQLMQLFDVLQKILRHRKKGENEEAEQEINYFYQCLKIDDDVRKLSLEQLVNVMEAKKFCNEQIELVAFVLKEQGEMEVDEGDRLNFFRKAHFLLQKVEQESTSFSMDRQMKIAELNACLN